MRPVLAFIVGLGVFELVFLRLPYKRLAWLTISGDLRGAAVHAGLALWGLATLAAVAWMARSGGRVARVLASVAGVAAISYEYGYQMAFGRFSTGADLAIAAFASNPEHRLDAVLAFVNPLAVAPCIAWVLLIMRGGAPPKSIGPGLPALAFAAIGWPIVCWSSDREIPVLSLPNAGRSVVSATFDAVFRDPGPRETVVEKPVRRGSSRVVLVIDEAVDAGHLSLNGYGRKTTPALDEIAGALGAANWGTAISGATCSSASVELLLSGLRTADLPDIDRRRFRVPNIFQWAKAAGYRTTLLDGQMTTFWIGPPRDRAFVDEAVLGQEFGLHGSERHSIDLRIAERLREILVRPGPAFVVVLKAGLHYPYFRRFPESSAPWRPFWTGRRVDLSRLSELVNAYDNGIAWSTDRFFRILFGSPPSLPADTVLLYTSDHGQALGRSGRASSHCGDSPFQAMVPLLLFGYGAAVDTSFDAAHENVFPTLLELMGFDPPGRYALSLLRARARDSGPRGFAGADLSAQPITGIRLRDAPR